MTGPDGQDTRPISVAELLARNGTIGAPPVGGRRRRRRGNTDAVTVAELTGEIPIIRAEEAEQSAAPEEAPAEKAPAEESSAALEEVPAPTNGVVETEAEPEPEVQPEAEAEEDIDEHGAALADGEVTAEEMVPDPVDIDVQVDIDDEDAELAMADEDLLEEVDEPPSYLHAVREPLFGGRLEEELRGDEQSYDDVAHLPEVPAETTTAADHEEVEAPTRMQQIGRGALTVLQSILAVAFGAGLFIAFDELWKWNNIVALVLSVLVILGLVVGVRIVRKTEDIASTLIAVAVGALVTLGPLALLQSG